MGEGGGGEGIGVFAEDVGFCVVFARSGVGIGGRFCEEGWV